MSSNERNPGEHEHDEQALARDIELEPQLQLIAYLRGAFIDAHWKDFHETQAAEKNGRPRNAAYYVLADIQTFSPDNVEHITLAPNEVMPDLSFDEYHEKMGHLGKLVSNQVAEEPPVEAEAAQEELFPQTRSAKMPRFRAFRLQAPDESQRIHQALAKGYEGKLLQEDFVNESSRFILMAIPEDGYYPDIYYLIDPSGVTTVFAEEGDRAGFEEAVRVLTGEAEEYQKSLDEDYDEVFGEDSHDETIARMVQNLERYYNPVPTQAEPTRVSA